MKRLVKKLCKECGKKPKYANTNYCFTCYRLREKKKKEEKAIAKKLKKESTKKFQKELVKRLHDKAWKLISELVRRDGVNLDGYGECYTCDIPIHWKEADCGHFKHDRLDLDRRNLKRQCVKCNRYESGKLDVYASRLIKDNGLDWFNQLERDAVAYNKPTVEELKQIIEDLQIKLRNLELLKPHKPYKIC